MRLTAYLFILAFMVSGCQFLGLEDFGKNHNQREKWASESNGTYSYLLTRSCFCWPAGVFRVEVEDYSVVAVFDSTRGEPLDSTLFDQVETIEAMFDLVDKARKEKAFSLDVEYSDQGYPTSIQIDWIENAVDDELYLGISRVKIE